MKANLHLHSRHSDGSLWPNEIAKLASEAGLEAAALTDHDTLGGTGEFLATCAGYGVRAYIGCEIDCVAPEIGYKSEILAYFPHGETHHARHFLRAISATRFTRMAEFVDRCRTIFSRPDLDFGELCSAKIGDRFDAFDAEDFSFNKVDIFNYLKRKKTLPESAGYREFKKTYFDSGLISDAKFPKPHVRDVAATIVADGGFLVIPHIGHEFADSFGTMGRERRRLETMLGFFRDAGVTGIEMYYYRNPDAAGINELVLDASKGFFTTWGSDCHGPGSGKFTIGDFSGDFPGFPDFGVSH
ncbi:MAG: PHP domain-containing protein [Spirochaetes bacterium]|nr:PHP domain-containing protein [Spirochaetota bacterium]